jgi:hypothetical protein
MLAFKLQTPVNNPEEITQQRNTYLYSAMKGHAVAQLVEALHYKRGGHGFDSQWHHWNFN